MITCTPYSFILLIQLFLFSSTPRPKKPVNLCVVSVQATNIPPKETVTYTKQTQTSGSTGGLERDGE